MNNQETIKRLNNLKTSGYLKFFVVLDKTGNFLSLPSSYRKRKKFIWNRKCDIMQAYNYYFRDKQVVKDLLASGELKIEEASLLPPGSSLQEDSDYITEMDDIKTRLAKLERATEVFGNN